MKKIIYRFAILALCITLASCFNTKNDGDALFSYPDENFNQEYANANIENVLLQQVLYGHGCEAIYDDSVKYMYTESDMIALGDILKTKMEDMGLQLNPKLFKQQVEKTHGVKCERPCHFALNENRMMMYIIPGQNKPEPQYDFNFSITESTKKQNYHVIFDPRVGLMYPALFLPEVIDYAKEYHNVALAEASLKIPKIKGEKIKKWKDDKYLSTSRTEVLNMIYHINKYIIYEDRESLDFLVNTNMNVLQSMFVDFRMENEPMIDSLILIRTRRGKARLEALFAEREADGSVYTRQGLLDYITKNEKQKTPKFQNTIHQYIAGCFGHDSYYDRMERFPKILTDNFTLDERRQIVAKILNAIYPVYVGQDIDKTMEVIIKYDPGFIDYAVKNKYFGLDELRTCLSIYRMRFLAEKWTIRAPFEQ